MAGWMLPLTAGFVAAFNPCGVALLPAYVAHLIGGEGRPEPAVGSQSPVRTLFQGAAAGTGMAAGVLVVFGFVGLLATAAGTAVMRAAPWLAVAVGLILIASGGLLLGSGSASGAALAGRVQRALAGRGRGWPRFIMYGAGYGLASLGCTLPVFLAVVIYSLTAAGPAAGFLHFLAYALGMGLAVTGLSVLSLLARDAAQGLIRRLLPHVPGATGALLAASGLYLIYYWLWGPGRVILG